MTTKAKKFSLFSDRQFYRSLFALAVPIMFQNLINSFVNIIDTVMIGRLGTAAIAAVGLGNQVFFLFTMVLFGICSGGSIFTAQYWGKKDIQGIRKNTGLCLFLNMAIALIFTILVLTVPDRIIGFYSQDLEVIRIGSMYLKTLAPVYVPFGISFVFIITLRSIERVRLAMVSTLIALSLNMGLNWIFIFGAGPVPAMGVKGAAIATVIARIVEMLILVTGSYRRKYQMAGTLREYTGFSLTFVSRFFIISGPVIFNELIWALGITVQNIIFARTGTDAIAAFNITNTFSQLTWVVFIGLGSGVAVLIGKKIGEGAEDTARDYAKRIVIFATILAAVIAAILYPFSMLLPFIFNVNLRVMEYVSIMFIILCCSYPFRAFNMNLIVGVCRAGGDTIFCVLFEVFIMWGYSLPLGAMMAFIVHAPVWLIYLCLCSEDVFKMILGLWRLKSGRWLRTVV
ncbi:MAG: MATE family efflux transporter [Spirochaetaceae bacterium]|jgi:putative MATE family efflux protein|nr:MATE family efflux transporter [Spirochaetaceae bacterium]